MRQHVSIFIFISMLVGLGGCQHEADMDPTDAQLLALARNTTGATWYKESDAKLPRSAGSGHNQALLRTRFNPIASTVLDTNGQVVPDTLFPNGSVIVKELWDDASTLSLYAILFKKPDHPYADADGWVWGYVEPDGNARELSSNKGMACRGCHSGTGNIDFSLMNEAFP